MRVNLNESKEEDIKLEMHCVIPTMRSVKIKFFAFSILIFTVYLFLFYVFIEVWFSKKGTPAMMTSVTLPYVIIHIDLKGSPPKLEYLKSLLPMMKDLGVNGLLMEYEDMFPYEGKLVNLSARNCYKRAELKSFLMLAVHSGFEIIPLVQTFGHMEHVLKLREFRHLREVPVFPDSICPSKLESKAIVKHMLEQVINFHNSVTPLKHVHVGCDEVYHMNHCAHCMIKGTTNKDLFIEYVKHISYLIADISPETTVLIWDDMLRSIKPIEWSKIECFNNVEPVYWDYSPNLSASYVSMLNYHRKFRNIWAASAFKGADGITATLPNLKDRILNNFSWMNFILDYKFAGESKVFNFNGIILTGWSRYSHMDPACELLPAAMPSLIINLLIIKRFKSGIVVETRTDLFELISGAAFKKIIAMNGDGETRNSLKCTKMDFQNIEDFSCLFESTHLYNVLKEYIVLSRDIESGFFNDTNDLSSVEYYSKSKHINKNHLITNLEWCNKTLNELQDLEVKMVNAMKKYYEDDFISEYVTYKMYESKTRLKRTLEVLYSHVNVNVWERGPRANLSRA